MLDDLLGFVLELGLEFIAGWLDSWVGWRFFLPILGSFGIVALIFWLIPGHAVRIVLSIPTVITGGITGLAWEFGRREH